MRLAGSARKHGVDDIDIQTAVADHRLRIALDDDSPQRQLVLGFDTEARLQRSWSSSSTTTASPSRYTRWQPASSTETYSGRGAEDEEE